MKIAFPVAAGQTKTLNGMKISRNLKPEQSRRKDEVSLAGSPKKHRLKLIPPKPYPRIKPLPPKRWTVLLYLAADNDLEPHITRSLLELEKVGSTSEINFVAQLDRGEAKTVRKKVMDEQGRVSWLEEKASNPHGALPEANRYYLESGGNSQKLSSPVVERLGKTDSADYRVLRDFLSWGFENYPAENYLVILGDHGEGFRGGMRDDGSNSGMKLEEIKAAFLESEASAGVDKNRVILGFNACFMGQVEVAYGLKDAARAMVASEETEDYGGWAYPAIFGRKKTAGSYNQEEMLAGIMDSVKHNGRNIITQSVTELAEMEQLKDSVDILAKAMLSSPEPASLLRETLESAQAYGQYLRPRSEFYGNFRDVYDVAEKFFNSERIKDKQLKKAALGVMKSVKKAVSAETHRSTPLRRVEGAMPGHSQMAGDFRGSHGLTINANYQRNLEGGYGRSDFAKDTMWFKALQRLREKD